MVPFSFPQPLLKSRVMKKHSSTIEVWTPEVWSLKLGAFTLSCLPAFLIVIPAPAFRLYSAPPCLWPIRLRPSVVKNNGVHGVDHRPSRWLKTQKRLNEPNSKNANHLVNIDDLTNFDFFEKRKRTQFNPIPTQFLSLNPIHILIMPAARAARTCLGFKALLKGFKVI